MLRTGVDSSRFPIPKLGRLLAGFPVPGRATSIGQPDPLIPAGRRVRDAPLLASRADSLTSYLVFGCASCNQSLQTPKLRTL
jgi:hypothetical protein